MLMPCFAHSRFMDAVQLGTAEAATLCNAHRAASTRRGVGPTPLDAVGYSLPSGTSNPARRQWRMSGASAADHRPQARN
jgi:hypothetical protein